jgi:phage baseplate assembly protein W
MFHIDYPFHFDARGRTARTGEDDHIRDMIEQFLFTNYTERVNRPDFGSGLLQMVYAPNSPELAGALQFTIQGGLERWLDDLIEVQDLRVECQEATLYVHLTYLVRRTNQIVDQQFQRSAAA